jgi:NAD(P)-dependent dehydrogenase (short-subunit alcohol dehydrogenase family)
MVMKVNGSIALVTGASRGLGRQFAQQLLDRGAAKVYATARRPEQVDIPGAEVLGLDITDPASVTAAAAAAGDVTLLVNNAGVATRHDLVTGDLDKIRLELDTSFYGTLAKVRAFAPVLAAGGGGAVLNVMSAMSWLSFVGANAYGVAKAAEWSLSADPAVTYAGQLATASGQVRH